MITTHYLLLYALFCTKPAAHEIRKWWNELKK